jgi:hypothetical protein
MSAIAALLPPANPFCIPYVRNHYATGLVDRMLGRRPHSTLQQCLHTNNWVDAQMTSNPNI